MATDERNLEESNKSEWQNETNKAGLTLDNLVETAEDSPYAYILIAVEKESEGTSVGVQVNGVGTLLAQGLATFLAKDDYTPVIHAANHLAAQCFGDEPEEDPTDELIARLRSMLGDK